MFDSDYYAFRSEVFVGDYFGDIGTPVKVSYVTYKYLKINGYRTVEVPAGTSMKAMLTKVLIDSGVDLKSYKAEETFKKYVGSNYKDMS